MNNGKSALGGVGLVALLAASGSAGATTEAQVGGQPAVKVID
ncbi:hypothetical protein N0B31_02790 [Salinirubellus salinus]|uniref:Uncharacterized protein n=1 Tax=Salinirubellus salinus TaxID=1364945 RepID=A0A9E7UBI5_9EURY|nr:hypothetical protein [Salinirubellus salinus]UWM55218.1 hypothetical protein N0B31_02790 [Salinirubellus salinus]